jgi:chemotaxis protein methyltransferase CheR
MSVELARISDDAFGLLSRLVHRVAGIHLPPPKRALVEARLGRRLRALGMTSFHDYYRHASTSEGELVELLDAICTNETRFFREAAHFTYLRERAIPRWRRLRGEGWRGPMLWSAACSTGEEPYSLAMTLTDELPGWDGQVLATDLSTRVLGQAARAEWSIERAAQIPPDYLKRYMLRGTGDRTGRMRASTALRERVRLQRCNLHEDTLPRGPFDAIFCCNVLIYFDRDTRRAVLRRLADRLTPDGLLFLGSAEIVDGNLPLRKVAPNAYTRAESRVW